MKKYLIFILLIFTLISFHREIYAENCIEDRGFGYGIEASFSDILWGTTIVSVQLPHYATLQVLGTTYYLYNCVYYQRDDDGNYYVFSTPYVEKPNTAIHVSPIRYDKHSRQ